MPYRKPNHLLLRLFLLVNFGMACSPAIFAAAFSNRYALILEDPPVAERYASRESVQSAPARSYQQQVVAKQQALRTELTSRSIGITGSASSLLNAVFVIVPRGRESELKSLPGVKAVIPLRRYHLNLNRATQLVNAPAAWNALGGVQNAGAGIKIAVIDTGIDQTHPAFQDSSLSVPAGFPKCTAGDCVFTNNKVIVARSYVRSLAAGSDSSNPAADSRPDDYSARDRSGHGTAVASCAAGVTNTSAVTFTGMAPKAWLGNYKIYGSPEVNDFSSDDVIIMAFEDAMHDGMDIVSLSTGGPAFSGALDSGAACGNPAGVPCDPLAQAAENAAKAGMTVVVAAGNSGGDGNITPTFNTISSPADAPSAIAVGATTNGHFFIETVKVPGSGVPSNLQQIGAQFGDGFTPAGPVTAPLRDVTRFGDSGFACGALPAGSMNGAFALIKRGNCNFIDKLTNAQQAGALGVIFYMATSASPIPPGGLAGTTIPAVMVANSDGVALKSFVDTNVNHAASIDPTPFEVSSPDFDLLTFFSSLGPATGDGGLKPELVAVGTDMYMAAQSFDPLGDVYSPSGYGVANGTSFATPLVSGAAALVKQSHPNYTSAQIKSALVNSASNAVTGDDSGNSVGVQSIGAGKLDAGAAVSATVTSSPATLSFGVVKSGSLPINKQLQVTNTGSSAANLSMSVVSALQAPGVNLALDKQSLALAPGASGTVNVTLSGGTPAAGSYSGVILVQGQGSLRIPFLYLAGNGVAGNLIPLTGLGFDGTVGENIPDGVISFKLIDSFGVPVSGASVTFSALDGGTIQNADPVTDVNGIATSEAILGSQPGTYTFNARAGNQSFDFQGNARLKPSIGANGIVNAASFEGGRAVAPGSYISIFGTGLSDATDSATTASLPLAIDFALVTFDVPSAHISVPGRLVFVSPNQVNLQVPWELQGQTSAQVKVTIDFSNGNVYTLPLSDFSPAFFEIGNGAVAALDLNYKVIGAANPARRGDTVQLFANGLGPVTNQPASGEPAPSSPFAETKSKPVVMIGSASATVSFSGLAPGFPGLNQINAVVPSTLTPGTYPITVSIGGQTSKASTITVQ
jgi:minor extracellular serine protease Vpr